MMKLASKGLGPYKVLSADAEKGNVVIGVGGKEETVKHNQVHLAKISNLDENKIIPALNETVIIDSLDEIRKLRENVLERNRHWTSLAQKSKLNLVDLVGRRIALDWKSYGKTNGIQSGTIIGYTNNLSKALVYYDNPFTSGDPRQEYYAENLSADRCSWKYLD
jgi:hypothetical protein